MKRHRVVIEERPCPLCSRWAHGNIVAYCLTCQRETSGIYSGPFLHSQDEKFLDSLRTTLQRLGCGVDESQVVQ